MTAIDPWESSKIELSYAQKIEKDKNPHRSCLFVEKYKLIFIQAVWVLINRRGQLFML